MVIRALITGGAGFFGHHLVEHILKNTDWHIAVMDKLTYASKGFDRLRDIGVYDDKRIARFTHDFTQLMSEGLMYELGDVDYVLHVGAETHVDNSISDPGPFVYSNVVGTYQLLELARKKRPKAFVYFSTDEVFGPARQGRSVDCHFDGRSADPLQEYREWDRYNSTNPYSATKAGGEELCLAYANTYHLPVIITHCMNLFGERQHGEKFIPKVIRYVQNGGQLHIHADSNCKQSGSRSYIHARNAADAVLFLLKQHDGYVRDKWNIKGEMELSNLELATFVAEYLKKELRYELVDFHSSRPGHDLRYALNGDKLSKAGWKSPVGFWDSLRKTIDWYIAHPDWL